jgi:hypothetical protein
MLRSSPFYGIAALLALLSGCTPSRTPQAEEESPTRGTVELLCDDAITGILTEPLRRFDSLFPDAQVALRAVPAREAMRQLLARTARLVVLARGYLPDEDSLMRAFGVPAHPNVALAEDALVFFVHPKFPLDTLNVEQLRAVLSGRARLRELFPQLRSEPEWVCPSTASSVYAHLVLQVLGGRPPRMPLRLVSQSDSVQLLVEQSPNRIGIGYLSHIARRTNVKALELGFTDSTGAYVSPKPVHQAYVVLRKYPYIVPIRAYLRDDLRNLPWTVATFLGTDAEVQRYFRDIGIVPAFAQIRLIPEE